MAFKDQKLYNQNFNVNFDLNVKTYNRQVKQSFDRERKKISFSLLDGTNEELVFLLICDEPTEILTEFIKLVSENNLKQKNCFNIGLQSLLL
jgi:hypothetical protein